MSYIYNFSLSPLVLISPPVKGARGCHRPDFNTETRKTPHRHHPMAPHNQQKEHDSPSQLQKANQLCPPAGGCSAHPHIITLMPHPFGFGSRWHRFLFPKALLDPMWGSPALFAAGTGFWGLAGWSGDGRMQAL